MILQSIRNFLLAIAFYFKFYFTYCKTQKWFTNLTACLLSLMVETTSCCLTFTFSEHIWNECIFARSWQYVLSAGRGSSAGSGGVDSGGKERLHQFAELQLLLRFCLHPDSCWSHRDSDRDNRMLCHSEGDEESFGCGEVDGSRVRFLLYNKQMFSLVTQVLTPPNYVRPVTKNRNFKFLFTHTQPSLSLCVLKVNPWWPCLVCLHSVQLIMLDGHYCQI